MNRVPKPFLGLAISAVIIAAVLTAGILYFQNIKESYKKKIENLRDTYQDLNRDASVIEETKRQRINFYKRRHYLDFPLKYSYAAADFIRRLSLIVPGKIKLIEVEINSADQSFTFLLYGKIKSDNNIKTKSKFLEFYRELEQFEDLIHIKSSNLKVKPGENKSGTHKTKSPVKTGSKDKQTELYFTINGEIEIW